jgi:hypothetical protein
MTTFDSADRPAPKGRIDNRPDYVLHCGPQASSSSGSRRVGRSHAATDDGAAGGLEGFMKKRLTMAIAAGALVMAMAPGIAAADEHIEVLEDVASVIAVNDPATTPDYPLGSMSRADCAFLVRVVADDGSSEEFMTCSLSDEPVMIPERQGSAPAEPLMYGGGECIWASDYHFVTDGTDVKASAFEVTVTPSGRAFAWSSYPAEPLDCPAE